MPEPLTPEEMEAVKKEYNTKNKQLPKMEYDDAITRYFYLKADDVIRIIRYSLKSGSSIYYRKVYPGQIN